MKTKENKISIQTECIYEYDIHFESGTEDKERKPITGKKYDSPLRIGEELPAWWTNGTYVITRIIRQESGDVTHIMVKPSGLQEFHR